MNNGYKADGQEMTLDLDAIRQRAADDYYGWGFKAAKRDVTTLLAEVERLDAILLTLGAVTQRVSGGEKQ